MKKGIYLPTRRITDVQTLDIRILQSLFMNNSFLNRFTPKEPKFFDFLKQVSEIFVDVSEHLQKALQAETVEQRREFFHQIKEKEHAADVLARSIFDALGTSFITPFDREDIHELADCMDDVIDLANSCSKRLVIYNPKALHPAAFELGKIVADDARCVDEAIDYLAVMKKQTPALKECIERLHVLENKADEIYEKAITQLFAEEKDAVELIKAKEILSILEKTTDASERIGKALKTIVVKYA